MQYVARLVHMPWGEERHSQVVDIVAGKVFSVVPFLSESQSMVFIEEVYLTSCDTAVLATEINIELHHAGGALYAYSVGEDGVLSRLS